MLAVGVMRGDHSEFNVLIGSDGPVIIDFRQSVDTASNTNARRLLLRDAENLHRFLARSVPNAPRLPYAEETWDLHELNALTAETRLTGRYRAPQRRMSTESVRDLIHDADRDERKRRDALGLRGGSQAPPPPARGEAPRRSHTPQHTPQRRNALLAPGGLVSLIVVRPADTLAMLFLPSVKNVLGRPHRGNLEPLVAALARGEIEPIIEHRFPLAEAEEAHQLSRGGKVVGKLLLVP
jgi:hypothetical protein